MRHALVFFLIGGLLAAAPVRAAERALSRPKHKARVSAAAGRFKFRGDLALLTMPDPTCEAGSVTVLRLRSAATDYGDVALPCEPWRFTGRGYSYFDAGANFGGVSDVKWKSGSLELRLNATGLRALGGRPEWFELALTVGRNRYCGRFASLEPTASGFVARGSGPCEAPVEPTPTATRTFTALPPSATATATHSATVTHSATRTVTRTATSVAFSPTPTATVPAASPSATSTASATAAASTATRTATATATRSATASPTRTATATATRSPTASATATASATPTPTASLPNGSHTPEVRITGPANGSFFSPATSQLTVSGEISNLQPGQRVSLTLARFPDGAVLQTVDVTPTPLAVLPGAEPRHAFSRLVPVDPGQIVNPIVAEVRSGATVAARDRITALVGSSIADGDPAPQGLAVRVDQGGFDALEPLLLDATRVDVNQMLPPGTYLRRQCQTIFFIPICVDAYAAGGSIAATDLNLDTYDEYGLLLDFDVSNLVFDVDLRNPSDGSLFCTVRLTADVLHVNGGFQVAPDTHFPAFTDVTESFPTEIAFTGLRSDYVAGICNWPFIGDFIQLLMGDVTAATTAGVVEYFGDPDGSGPLDSVIGDLVEDSFDSLAIAGLLQAALGLDVSAPYFAIASDDLGMTFGNDVAVTVPLIAPGAPDPAASLHVPGVFPVFGEYTPVQGRRFDLAVSLSASMLNQIVRSELESGLLQSTVTEADLDANPLTPPQKLTAGAVAALGLPELATLDAGRPLQVALYSPLAPLLTGNPGPNGRLSELLVPNLLAAVSACECLSAPCGALDRCDSTDALTPLFTLAVDYRTGLDLQLAAGLLTPLLALPDNSDLALTLVDNPIGLSAAGLAVLHPLLRELVPGMGASFGAIPIPTLLGLQGSGVEISQSGGFVSLFVNLD